MAGWEVAGWEVAGGKSEDRCRSLEIESINRCRSNRFGHGMIDLYPVIQLLLPKSQVPNYWVHGRSGLRVLGRSWHMYLQPGHR